MPKETIISAQPRTVLVGGTDSPTVEFDAPLGAPSVSVVWHTGDAGWVQLLVEVDPRWLAQAMAERVDDETSPVTLYTEVLHREHLNKLIRIGRRARDTAYGRDE